MRILNKQEFLKLPLGTIFHHYGPAYGHFEILSIKGENIIWPGQTIQNADFFLKLIPEVDCNDAGELIDIIDDSINKGTSFKLDFEVEQRECLYKEDQLYAVWEKDDIEGLIKVLQNSLKGTKE